MRDGLIESKDMGIRVFFPTHMSMFATACYKAGETAEGLHFIGEALSSIEATSERHYEAELLRLKGELLLARAPPDVHAAETCFLKAIEVGRHQSAKLWELRAATSLARLWRDAGRPTEARDQLSPVYNWFTEGFDLPDLRDALALLDNLDQILSERALRSG
jgi:predicted ATPase